MTRSPQLVLDGAVLAAEMVGARETVIVAHPAARRVMDDAAAERARVRFNRVRIRVRTAADRFVAGEASAVVHWIERGVPAPMASPPRVGERGLRGAPTLVQNVETLAHLALIARYGAAWFRSVGTPAEPGSMLVTVLGAVHEPVCAEIAVGTPIGQALDLAGGRSAPLQALLLGGYFGDWVSAAVAIDRPFSSAGLADLGAGRGRRDRGTARRCLRAQGNRPGGSLPGRRIAGQCGPCRFGLDAIAGQVERLAHGRGADARLLHRWLGQVDGRGGCAHPTGVVRLIRSSLRVFDAELRQHAMGWCCGTASVLPVPPGRSR